MLRPTTDPGLLAGRPTDERYCSDAPWVEKLFCTLCLHFGQKRNERLKQAL